VVCLCIHPCCHTYADHVHLSTAGPFGTAGLAGCVCVRPNVCAPRGQVLCCIVSAMSGICVPGAVHRVMLAACGHPRPRMGVGTLFAFRIGRFLVGPTGLEAQQPSRSSTPSLGAWLCLWGSSPPPTGAERRAVWNLVWLVSWVSEIRPAGLGLTVAWIVRYRAASDFVLSLDFSIWISLFVSEVPVVLPSSSWAVLVAWTGESTFWPSLIPLGFANSISGASVSSRSVHLLIRRCCGSCVSFQTILKRMR
jgi:hypothetical protein